MQWSVVLTVSGVPFSNIHIEGEMTRPFSLHDQHQNTASWLSRPGLSSSYGRVGTLVTLKDPERLIPRALVIHLRPSDARAISASIEL